MLADILAMNGDRGSRQLTGLRQWLTQPHPGYLRIVGMRVFVVVGGGHPTRRPKPHVGLVLVRYSPATPTRNRPIMSF
jgi:hypothetical protein